MLGEFMGKEIECETAARPSAPGPAAEKPSQRLPGSPRPRPGREPPPEEPAMPGDHRLLSPEELVECVIKGRAV